MKKVFSFLLVMSCVMLALSGAAETPVRVAALKGPTAMGMVQMMQESDNLYDFTLAASADTVTPALVQGKLDIAAVPANLASVLYNNADGAIQVLGINTLGVLYIVERGEAIYSVDDLRGKTLYTAGKGSTPEYALNYILSENGLDPKHDLNIEFKSEHAECLAALLNDPTAVAMLPQPFATVAQTKAEDMRIALDLTAAWDVLQSDSDHPSAMLTGVVIARTSFIEENPEVITAFLEDYAKSVSFVQNDISNAAKLIGEYDIFEAGIAEKALPYCNITLIVGEEMQTLLSGYLAVLYEQNPTAVGGKLPDEAFYYLD